MKLSAILLSCISLFSVLHAHADETPAKHAKVIDEILAANNADQLVSMIAQKLHYEILKSIEQHSPSDDFKHILANEIKKAVHEDFIKENQLNKIFHALYDEYFSYEELQEISNFLNSETGQNYKQYMSHINSRSFNQAKEIAAKTGEKVHSRLLDVLKDVRSNKQKANSEQQ